MSHFSVMVIGPDARSQMAPYQENNMGDCPDEYLQFYDVTAEIEKEYEESTVRAAFIDGRWKYNHDMDEEERKKYTLKEVPFKDIFKTFEDFAEQWCGYQYDEDHEAYGYYENPNAKWDWYVLGGRWRGYFTLVENPKYPWELGEGSAFARPDDEDKLKGKADYVHRGDINLEAMYEEATAKVKLRYNIFKRIVEEHGVPPRWSTVREKYSPDIDAARDIYNNHPAIKKLNEARLVPIFSSLYDLYHIELGVGDKALEACIEDAKCNAIVPFAIVKDGKWYEKGEMGWFGIVSDPKLQYDWSSEFFKMFEELPPDTEIHVFDCHI